jgi:hypothetical protein
MTHLQHVAEKEKNIITNLGLHNWTKDVVPVHIFAANSRVGSCCMKKEYACNMAKCRKKHKKKENYNDKYNKLPNKRIIQNGLV